MQKEAAGWLALRLIGLFLLGCATFELFSFVKNLLTVVFAFYAPRPGQDFFRLVNLNWEPFFEAIVWAAFAGYFLLRGKMIHRWLMRENGSNGNA